MHTSGGFGQLAPWTPWQLSQPWSVPGTQSGLKRWASLPVPTQYSPTKNVELGVKQKGCAVFFFWAPGLRLHSGWHCLSKSLSTGRQGRFHWVLCTCLAGQGGTHWGLNTGIHPYFNISITCSRQQWQTSEDLKLVGATRRLPSPGSFKNLKGWGSRPCQLYWPVTLIHTYV